MIALPSLGPRLNVETLVGITSFCSYYFAQVKSYQRYWGGSQTASQLLLVDAHPLHPSVLLSMALTTRPPPQRIPEWLEVRAIATSRSVRELPKNVMKNIMDHAERTRDRKSWIYAVQYDKDLYEHALQNYYPFFVISRKNLVRDQEMPIINIRSHGRDLAELMNSLSPLGDQPALPTFVESLLLNCQYGHKGGMDASEAQLWRFVLSLLEPHLVSLAKIQHHGPLEQPLWDTLLQHRQLRILSIRQTDTLSLADAIAQPQESAALVSWERLVALGTVRHLDIGRLLTAEASGLALAVRQLPKLKCLRIEAAPLATTLVHNAEVGYGVSQMPIARFLRFLFYTASMPPGFPISLSHLTIIDNGHEYGAWNLRFYCKLADARVGKYLTNMSFYEAANCPRCQS